MVSDCCTSQLDMISRDVTRSVRCSSTFTVSPFFEVPDSRYKASGLGSVGLGNARRRRRRRTTTTTRTTPTPRPTPTAAAATTLPPCGQYADIRVSI